MNWKEKGFFTGSAKPRFRIIFRKWKTSPRETGPAAEQIVRTKSLRSTPLFSRSAVNERTEMRIAI